MTGTTTHHEAVSIGKTLKAIREGKNISLNDIASKMRLDVRFIAAIEEDQFDSLPDPIYVRGYIRSYSKLVGADADVLVRSYEEQGGNFEPEIIPEIRHSSQTSSSDKPVKAFTYLIAFALVVLLIAWWQSNFVINAPTVSPETISQIRQEQAVEPVIEAPAYALPEYRPSYTSDNLQEIPVVPTGTQVSAAGVPVETATIEPPLESTTATIVVDPLTGALPPAPGTTTGQVDTPLTGAPLAVTPTATPGAIDPAAAQAIPTTPTTVATATDTSMMTGMTPLPAPGVTSTSQTPVYQTTGPDLIVLKLTADSWIEIIDAKNTKVFFDLGRPGDVFNVRGTAPFDVLLGFAQAVSVEFNGKPFNAAPYSRAGVARFTLGE
jgi:cytoskeleton protein RodZ